MQQRKPPKLPSQLWSPLGPVRVQLVDRIKPLAKDAPDDVNDFGQYDPNTRTISICKSLHPWAQWQTLHHEWVHMVFFDAGYHNAFEPNQIEGICDLIGTARAAEMRNQP